MRDVAFRVWDPRSEQMYGPTTVEPRWFSGARGFAESRAVVAADVINRRHGSTYERDDLVLMQYTGLPDAEGKPIYEGDILRFMLLGSPTHYEVAWNEQYADWRCRAGGEWISKLWSQLDGDDCVVAGNRYENPELLEQ